MLTFFKGAFGIGDGETEKTPQAARRAADLRDNVLDQLVTIAWTLLLLGQEWGLPGSAWGVTSMGATALGYAAWRLVRLVPRYRSAAGAALD